MFQVVQASKPEGSTREASRPAAPSSPKRQKIEGGEELREKRLAALEQYVLGKRYEWAGNACFLYHFEFLHQLFKPASSEQRPWYMFLYKNKDNWTQQEKRRLEFIRHLAQSLATHDDQWDAVCAFVLRRLDDLEGISGCTLFEKVKELAKRDQEASVIQTALVDVAKGIRATEISHRDLRDLSTSVRCESRIGLLILWGCQRLHKDFFGALDLEQTTDKRKALLEDFLEAVDTCIAKTFEELVTHGRESLAGSEQLTRTEIDNPFHFPEEEAVMQAMMVSDQSDSDFTRFVSRWEDQLNAAKKLTALRREYLWFKAKAFCYRSRLKSLVLLGIRGLTDRDNLCGLCISRTSSSTSSFTTTAAHGLQKSRPSSMRCFKLFKLRSRREAPGRLPGPQHQVARSHVS
eukprot:s1687_g12.t1